MKTVCEILTADPEGGPARIPFQLFQDLYRYLAHVDGEISQEHIQSVLSALDYHVLVSAAYLRYDISVGRSCSALPNGLVQYSGKLHIWLCIE